MARSIAARSSSRRSIMLAAYLPAGAAGQFDPRWYPAIKPEHQRKRNPHRSADYMAAALGNYRGNVSRHGSHRASDRFSVRLKIPAPHR
jgi:hypothetical protein